MMRTAGDSEASRVTGCEGEGGEKESAGKSPSPTPNKAETHVKAKNTPCERIETMKLPALMRKTTRYSAVKTTVHHETKTRNRTRSRMEWLGYEPFLRYQDEHSFQDAIVT